MADDDEVDILGDFSFSLDGGSNLLDNSPLVSQNSDLLNCDYTIHPQWLLDKPSGNPDNWYEENSASVTSDVSDSDSMGHIFTENSITDESGWTEKEKNLLQRGLEIFGKSSVRLSQFVGSKTPSEVKYYLKNFFTENLSHYQHTAVDCFLENMPGLNPVVLDGNQIPASMEEVIAVVSTGSATVTSPAKKRPGKKSLVKSCNPRKSSNKKVMPLKGRDKPQQTKVKSNAELKGRQKHVKFKTKQKSDFKRVAQLHQPGESTASKEITTGLGLSVPICEGEEIVTIKHVEDDSSDISIDIEDIDDSESANNIKQSENILQNITLPSKAISEATNVKPDEPSSLIGDTVDDVAKQLEGLEIPLRELVLDKHVVTELEKHVHSDFFESRPSKTPERYMKIRNHIINSWNTSKPNYVYKTSMRTGLKNCGDVNTISRIHFVLEQIGAINFGCEQTKYERPLGAMLQLMHPIKGKSVKQAKTSTTREPTQLGPRQRIKKKFHNDGEGGCTIVHGDKGEILDTTIVHEEPSKPRSYIKKPTIRLNYCRPFTPDKPQKYSVKINLSTLILMDFHSHSYQTEVMGLIGGLWHSEEHTLKISCYEPCKNLASSSTHCDMCPISQARAAENIHTKNFVILGWFHSHPTFAPEPSQQDLDTQQFVQQWIGHDKPCVGVILSPFSVNAALISSPLRCWMVDKKPNFEDQLVPYRFKVDIITDDFSLPKFLDSMKCILFADDENLRDKRIAFHKPYFQDFTISHLDKFITSVNMLLAKTGTLSKPACDEIIQGIRDLLIANF